MSRLRVYCDQCWTANDPSAERCANCGVDLTSREVDRVEGLIRALRHPLPERRAFAATILGRTGDARAAKALCEALASEIGLRDMELGLAVAEALGELREPSTVPTLARLANGPFLPVKVAAIHSLGAIGGEGALHELGRIAVSSPSLSLRQEAEEAAAASSRASGEA